MVTLRWKHPQMVAIELGALCEMMGIPDSALFHPKDGQGVSRLKNPHELHQEGILSESVWRKYVC